MKQCPQCRQTYSDDLMFCLSDGTPLAAVYHEPEEPTVVRAKVSRDAGPRGVSPLFKYLTFGLLFLFFIFAAGTAALWVFWPREVALVPKNDATKNIAEPASPTPTPSRSPAVRGSPVPTASVTQLEAEKESIEKEKERLAEERRKLEEQQRKAAETPTPVPAFVDPGTTRITFRRGSVGERTSGMIGRSRSFVLRTLGGQYLTARVQSPRGCVVFSNGSGVDAFVTGAGDSYLYLTNNCGSPSRFMLNVVVR